MDIRQLKDKALEHSAKRRFDKAAELYGQICAAEPRDLQTKQRWGDALRAAGKAKEAVVLYQDVADGYAKDGQLLKAIAVNKMLLEVDPSHTVTQKKLADLYARRAPAKPSQETRPLAEDPPAPTPAAEVAAPSPAPDAAELEARLTPLDQLTVPRTHSSTEIPIELDVARSATAPEIPQQESEELSDALFPTFDDSEHTEILDIGLEEDPFEPAAADPASDETLARIPESPLFETLDPGAFVDLLQRCKRRPFAVGDRLIQQGDPARSFFVVSTGILAVVQAPSADPTAEQELARLGPGDFFGELALVSNSPRIASVIATTEGEALEFPGEVLRDLIAAHPAAQLALNKFARARLLQNAMATSPLFRPFDRDQRKHLIARFVIREVPARAAVLTEGFPSDGPYVVMQGRFAVDHDGQRLATLGVGEIFGEISLLARANAGATVTAETAGRVLRLPRKSFDELILTHPQVLEMVSNLADERRQLNEGVASGKVSCDTEGLILM